MVGLEYRGNLKNSQWPTGMDYRMEQWGKLDRRKLA